MSNVFHYYSYEGPDAVRGHRASVCRYDVERGSVGGGKEHECWMTVYGKTEDQACDRAKWIAAAMNAAGVPPKALCKSAKKAPATKKTPSKKPKKRAPRRI